MSAVSADPAPSGRIFYGWWNVVASAVGMASCAAVFTGFAFGVFVLPMQNAFGWSRGEISFALTVVTITNVIVSPIVGTLMDRLGVKKVLLPSVVCLGLLLASLSQLTDRLWQFYLTYGLLTLLGAGTLPQSFSRVVVAWFFRRRGLALGLSLAGYGIGATLIPSLSQRLIDGFGWREAYVVLGAGVLVITLPLLAWLMRESPEAMGMTRDGDPAAGGPSSGVEEEESGLSGAEAARDPLVLADPALLLPGGHRRARGAGSPGADVDGPRNRADGRRRVHGIHRRRHDTRPRALRDPDGPLLRPARGRALSSWA